MEQPTNTKPAVKSRTIQSAIVGFLLNAWPALLMVAAPLFGMIGLDINTDAWLIYADDDVITATEVVWMVKDFLTAVVFLLVAKFRKDAFQFVSGIFGDKK